MLEIVYGLSVIFTTLISTTAISHSRVYQTMTANVISRRKLAAIGTIVTEYSFYFIIAKLFILYEFRQFAKGYMYTLDVLNLLYFWSLFLHAVFSRHPLYEQTKFMRDRTSSFPPLITSWSFWFRFHNPFWSSRQLLVQSNISYATAEELKLIQPGYERFLTLDVYQHPSFPRNRPVVIYIHGGRWTSGSKREVPPLIPYLALKKYVLVSIDYRLEASSITDQLIDVKRSIRWVRENIERFGGDPRFISVVGNGSGAHLATIASMTMNDPTYQPGFESVDTTIDSCVSLSGYYDVTRNWGYNFHLQFLKNTGCDVDISRVVSPTWRLKEAEANKKRSTATEEEKLGPVVPPFLIIHGKNDCLSPIKHVREFVTEFKNTCLRPDAKICMIELPSANHFFAEWSSIRAHMIGYAIEPFLRTQYERSKKKD